MPETRWLTTSIYSTKRLDEAESARRVLETICRHAAFTPDRYDWAEPIRSLFNPHDLNGPLTMLANTEGNKLYPHDPSGSVMLERKQQPKCSFDVSWSGIRLHPIEASSYSVDAQYTNKPSGLQEWLDFSFELFVEQDAWFGAIALDEEYTAKHKLVYTMPTYAPPAQSPGATVEAYVGAKLYQNIPGVYWGTYFGPFYVEWLGRDRFSTVPCIEQRWLPNGGVFLISATLPSEWQNPTTQTVQRQIRDHLGADAFFNMEQVRATFTQQLGKNNIFEPNQVVPKYRRPAFPFDESYKARLAEVALYQRDAIIQDQRKLGFSFIEETATGSLLFQNSNGDCVIVDPIQGILQHFPKM